MYGLSAANLKKRNLFFCFKTPVLLQKFARFIRCKRPEFVGDKEDSIASIPISAAVNPQSNHMILPSSERLAFPCRPSHFHKFLTGKQEIYVRARFFHQFPGAGAI